MLGLRITVLVVSVLACAWFGLGIRQAHDTDRAAALVRSPGTPTAHQTAEILSLLHAAGQLNPDHAVDELRAQAEIRAGQPGPALAQMQRVVREQPRDVDAWIVLGFAAGPRDPALAALARLRRSQLAPPVSARS